MAECREQVRACRDSSGHGAPGRSLGAGRRLSATPAAAGGGGVWALIVSPLPAGVRRTQAWMPTPEPRSPTGWLGSRGLHLLSVTESPCPGDTRAPIFPRSLGHWDHGSHGAVLKAPNTRL